MADTKLLNPETGELFDQATVAGSLAGFIVQEGSATVETDSTTGLLSAEDLAGHTLYELEEYSYTYALNAHDAEAKLWEVLAYIRDNDLWKSSTEQGFTFTDYMLEWIHEAAQRGATPFSVSYMQKRLASHRRLVAWAGADANTVLAAPLNVVAKLMGTISETWDYKTGEPLQLNPVALAAMDKEFPGETVEAKIAKTAEMLATMKPKEALGYIKDNLSVPPAQQKTSLEFVVKTDPDVPEIWAHLVTINDKAEVTGDEWFSSVHAKPWPQSIKDALLKKLSGTV